MHDINSDIFNPLLNKAVIYILFDNLRPRSSTVENKEPILDNRIYFSCEWNVQLKSAFHHLNRSSRNRRKWHLFYPRRELSWIIGLAPAAGERMGFDWLIVYLFTTLGALGIALRPICRMGRWSWQIFVFRILSCAHSHITSHYFPRLDPQKYI